MRKIQYKFTNLKKAYQRLVEVANLYDGKNEIIRDSLIQRFEFTYELTHKTLQEFFKYSGITMENSFPRMIYKKAYANHLIDNDKIWINLRTRRYRPCLQPRPYQSYSKPSADLFPTLAER